MNEKMPCSILSERDLEAYREYLKKQIGKPVTVESVICGKSDKRTGKLISVGADHIVLKGAGCQTTVCRLENIKFITVAHSGNMRR